MRLFNYSSQRAIRKTGTFYGKLNFSLSSGNQQKSWSLIATAFMASIKLLVFLAWISYGLCALVYAGTC